MANTKQDISTWGSKADLRRKFQKLNDVEAKDFYHCILDSLRQSIVQGDCIKFRKCAEFLEVINLSGNKDRIITYYDLSTNILLLGCEHQNHEVFKLILSNYCNVLSFSTAKLISPTDEDDMGRNAYYYLMRLNKLDMLKELIDKWPFDIEKHEMDIALSKAYLLLIVQKVHLTTDTRYFAEHTLNKIRLDQCIFGNIKQQPTSLKQIQDRSALLIDTIKNLSLSYKSNGNRVNDEILYALKFTALNISVLKRWLSCTYESIPWEEMEFCIVMYIKYFQSEEVSGVYYRSYVNRRNIFEYLKEFGVELGSIVNGLKKADLSFKIDSIDRSTIVSKVSLKNPVFKELIETFTKIRNFYSLRRMIYYLDCVLSAKKNEKSKDMNDIFAVERCLQVLGELMKNTPTAPNLSTDLGDSIFACFTDQLQKIIKNMRNSLSHTYGLVCRIATKDISLYSYENFMRVKDDLKELRSLISNILLRDQFEVFEDLYFEMTTFKNFEDYEHFKEVYNSGNVAFRSTFKSKSTNEMNILEGHIRNTCSSTNVGFSDGTNTEVMSCGAMQIFGEFKAKALAYNEKLLTPLFVDLERIFRTNKHIVDLNEDRGYGLLNMACNSIITVEDYGADPEKIFTKRKMDSVLEKFSFLSKVTEKSERLSSREEDVISYLLDEITYTCISTENEKALKLDRYQHKILFLLRIEKNSLKSIRNIDYNFKLTKKNVFQNKKLIEAVLDSKLDHLRLIFENYHIDNTFESIKSFVTHYGDSQIFLTVEMLLLDVLSIYESCLIPNIGIYDFYFPSLIGKELRNYLAHGNSTVDILDHNVKMSILINCLMFVGNKPLLKLTSTKLRSQQKVNDITVHIKHILSLIQWKSDFFQVLKYEGLCKHHQESKVDILSRTSEGLTVLHAAAHNADVNVFKYCLAKVPDEALLLSDDNSFKQNIIHIAALCNNMDLMSHLLREHSDTRNLLSDIDYKGNIPLHYASMFGESRMVEMLLEYDGSDVFVENKLHNRPIHTAILLKNVDAFRILLKFERSVNEKGIRGGFSIVHDAAESSNPEFLSILINRNANVNIKTETGYTPLHAACFYGGLENVKLLLSKNADLNPKIYENGLTPIFFAIENHHFEIVKTLLDQNVDVNAVQKQGHHTILHAAATAGCPRIIEELLMRKLGLNERTFSGETALHVAAKCNMFKAVQTILKHKKDLLNATDNFRTTAIYIAAREGHQEIFGLLLSHGANLTISESVYGINPIQMALQNGNMDIIRYLLKMNISIHEKENWKWAVFSENKDVVEAVFKRCDIKDLQDNSEKLGELLCVAIDRNSYSISEYLIKLGADVEYVLNRSAMLENHIEKMLDDGEVIKPLNLAILGYNPDLVLMLLKEHVRVGKTDWCFDAISEFWFLLCGTKNKDALASIMELFIRYGNIDLHRSKLINTSITRNNSKSLKLLLNSNQDIHSKELIFAVRRGYDEVCQLVLEKGKVDLNGKGNLGITLLHVAAMCGNARLVELLISKGCNVHARDDSNHTPIDYATIFGDGSIVEMLLGYGADFSSSLRIAAQGNHPGIAEFLLEKGADVNGSDPTGSPLHYAICEGNEQCINLLLSRENINVNYRASNGHTPLHIAAKVGNLEVTKILIEKGANVHAFAIPGVKPIHVGIGNDQIEIVKFYIENGYIKPTDLSGQGSTLLHYTAVRLDMEVTKYLLNLNLDINAMGLRTGNTPLHMAAAESSWEKCGLLIDCGAVYNMKNNKGNTPFTVANKETKPGLRLIHELFYLVDKGTASDVSDLLLIFADMNLNARDIRGMTVLHIAVLKEYDDIVEILLRNQINVNIKDFKSNTALHYAAQTNKIKIVQNLLSAGAVYNLKNANNYTPLHLTSNEEIRRYLTSIDDYFQHLKMDEAKFLDIFRSIRSREEQVRVLFGPRNSCNQSIHTYIVMNKLTDLQVEIDIVLNKDELEMQLYSDILFSRGEFRQSAEILRPLVTKYENDYGPMNPLTLEIRYNLLLSLYKINEYDYCLKENEVITREQTKLYGENSGIVLKSRELSGLCLHRLGKNKEALDVFEDVYKGLASLVGPTHRSVLQAKQHSVLVLNDLGKYEEALRVSDDIYDVQRRTLGEYDLSTIITLNNYALALNGLGKHAEAMKIFQEVGKKRETILGPTHPDTIRAMYNFISSLALQRKYREAINELKFVYELQKRVLGADHLESLNTKRRLVVVLLKTGRDTEAAEIIKEIYPKIKSILGPGHPALIALKFQKDVLNPSEIMTKFMKKFGNSEQLNDEEKNHLFDCIKEGRLAETIKLLGENKELANLSGNGNGMTPLHAAVDINDLRVFIMLNAYEANPLALTKNGNSILHIAVNRCYLDMTRVIVDLIRKSYNDVFYKFLNERTIKTGRTALHVAAQKNSYEICLFLLQNGATYNCITYLKQRPVDLTNSDSIKNLLNFIDKIFLLVKNRSESILDIIKNVPVDEITALKNCRNEGDKTIVQAAPQHMRQQIVMDLVEMLKTNQK